MENIEQYASCAGFEQYASIPFQMLSGCVMSRSGERCVRNAEVKGSNPSGSTTSERVVLVPIFLFHKKSVTRSTVPPFLQKVTLCLRCSLVNALTTLRLATNFLWVATTAPYRHLYLWRKPIYWKASNQVRFDAFRLVVQTAFVNNLWIFKNSFLFWGNLCLFSAYSWKDFFVLIIQ